jgi:hypothetical protein
MAAVAGRGRGGDGTCNPRLEHCSWPEPECPGQCQCHWATGAQRQSVAGWQLRIRVRRVTGTPVAAGGAFRSRCAPARRLGKAAVGRAWPALPPGPGPGLRLVMTGLGPGRAGTAGAAPSESESCVQVETWGGLQSARRRPRCERARPGAPGVDTAGEQWHGFRSDRRWHWYGAQPGSAHTVK